MKPSGVVTLLTDFGIEDPFVGVMKGVILGRFAAAALVDLTHVVEPGGVAVAAFWLGQAYRYFAPGTVHLTVVDPGVGTARAAVVARAAEQLFVGPDNGLFEVVARQAGSMEARRIDGARFGLAEPSRTFHGRDLFAPVAAELARGGIRFEDVGPEHTLAATELVPVASATSGGLDGEVLAVDRFGNLVTNVTRELLGDAPGVRVELVERSLGLVGTFGDVPSGECAACIGSFGQIEVFQRDGSAARALGAQRGARVRVYRSEAS